MDLIPNVFADSHIPQIIGTINPPLPDTYRTLGGLIVFVSNILRLVFLAAGIYAFINFIVAGYQYMMAAGDSKLLQKAWERIWQSFVGLLVIVASFAAAALFGYLLFNDAGFILNPKVYGPGSTP